jgi:hypothetical protein
MDATKVTIEKSTFVASSVFRDLPVPSALIKLQQTHMLKVMPPGRYSPVNELDYSSDDSDIEISAQELAECAAVCQAITYSTISRQFPALKKKKNLLSKGKWRFTFLLSSLRHLKMTL